MAKPPETPLPAWVIHTPAVRQNAHSPAQACLQTALFSFIIRKNAAKEAGAAVEDHTQLLIGLMQKTIEQKDEQIKEPRETVARLQATVANLNETLEEFRRKFFGSSSEKTGRKKGYGQKPYPREEGQIETGGSVPEPASQGGQMPSRGRRPALSRLWHADGDRHMAVCTGRAVHHPGKGGTGPLCEGGPGLPCVPGRR